MKKLLIAAAALTALTVSASAADMAARPMYTKAAPPVIAPPPSWTGFYIGGQVGGAWGDFRYANINLTGEAVGHRASAIAGGGHIGYNWQFSQIVLGAEVEFNATGLAGSSVSVANPLVTYGTRVNWYGTAVGRLGVAFDRVLLYVSGGAAFTELRSSGVNTGVDSFALNSQRTGWTVGAGLAYQITNNWIAGIDYKHLDFAAFNATGTTRTLLLPYALTGVGARLDQATARLSYKF